MRIARFLDQNAKPTYGIDLGNNQAEILSGCLFKGLTPTGQKAPITHRLAPLDPINIFCIGLNYLKHAKETGAELPNYPVVFMKPVSAKNDPGKPIKIPKACTNGPEVDYEAEFCVIIGKPARDVTPETALDYVLGYTCANDVSARKWQRNAGGGQWIKGKGFDTFCPLGPVLVTPDEIPDPQALRIQTRLNGQTMQDGHTSDMIFSVAKLIAYLSQDITLLPGTVILTGTPDGVGVARKPPVFLKPGDKLEIEIEKIGILANPVE